MSMERSPEHELGGDLARALRVAGASALAATQRRAGQAAKDARQTQREQTRVGEALARRIETQHQQDRATWQAARQPAWWDHANETAIASAWSAGVAWAPEDPDAAEAVAEMRSQLSGRYGINVDATPASGADRAAGPTPTEPTTGAAVARDPDRLRVCRVIAAAHPAGAPIVSATTIGQGNEDTDLARGAQRGAALGR